MAGLEAKEQGDAAHMQDLSAVIECSSRALTEVDRSRR